MNAIVDLTPADRQDMQTTEAPARPLTAVEHAIRSGATPEQLERVRETATRDDKQQHFNRLCEQAQANGYKLGWVAYRFKARWGHWPDRYRDTRSVGALPEVA